MGAKFRRRAENTLIALPNDTVVRVEAVDDGVVVAWQDSFAAARAGSRRFLVRGRAADETIGTVARIIRM